MSDKNKINHELNIISRYVGLLASKYIIFILLIITFYPMKAIPGYILLAGIIFPIAFRFASNIDDDIDKYNFTLYTTAKKYKFTYLKYRAESYNFTIIMFLLIVWQYTLNKNNEFDSPLNNIPAFMLIIYILSRFLVKILTKSKIHHNFMNMEF